MTDIPTIICANKCDKKRVVTEEEGKLYAMSKGLKYYETSALSGVCVTDMFLYLFEKIVDNTDTSNKNPSSTNANNAANIV